MLVTSAACSSMERTEARSGSTAYFFFRVLGGGPGGNRTRVQNPSSQVELRQYAAEPLLRRF